MASMFMVKNTLLRVSKAGFNPQVPSIIPRKVSRVCFASSSKFNENQYAKEDAGGDDDAKAAERIREARQVYENDEEAEEVERKYQELKSKAKDTADDMKSKAQEGAHNMREKAQEGAQQASEAMQEAKDKAQRKAQEGADRVGEAMHNAKERTKDTAGWTAEKTKEGAGKAAEAVQNVGEKAKETAKGAWETAKDATQKIKETIIGEDRDENRLRPEDYMEDHLPKHRPGGAKDQRIHRDLP